MIETDQKYHWMLGLGELNEQKIAELRSKPINVQMEIIRAVMKNERGISQAKKDSLMELQYGIDTSNFIRAYNIIKQHGYPGNEPDIGNISTILLHADPGRLPDDFYELLLGEVSQKRLKAKQYATIYDRIQIAKSQPELYYIIEVHNAETGKTEPKNPFNLHQTDSARKKNRA